MNKINRYLTIAIVAQLLLVLIFFISSTGSKKAAKAPFLNIDFTVIDAIDIVSDGRQITLKKDGEHWSAIENQGLASPKGTISNLLEELKKLEVNWPVATTPSAAERFEVSSENAQKIVKFKQGSNLLTTLYLGSSPGLRKVHARIDGSNDIYAVEFASHRFSSDSNEWFDKSLLKIDTQITAIKTEKFELQLDQKDNATWILNSLPEGKVSDDTAINAWVEQVRNLEVNKLIRPEVAEKITIQNPALTMNIDTKTESINYAFYTSNEETFIKVFGDTKLFSILDYQAKPILDANAEQFTKDVTAPDVAESNKEGISLDNPIPSVLDLEE